MLISLDYEIVATGTAQNSIGTSGMGRYTAVPTRRVRYLGTVYLFTIPVKFTYAITITAVGFPQLHTMSSCTKQNLSTVVAAPMARTVQATKLLGRHASAEICHNASPTNYQHVLQRPAQFNIHPRTLA